MLSRIAIGMLVFAATVNAQPSVVIELVPDNHGPYAGGESITVDVWAHSQVAFDVYVWFVQLDFSDSSDTLDLDPTFTFELSSSIVPDHFQQDFNLPIPWTSNWLEYACDPCRLQLPAGGSLHIGTIGLRLPTHARTYRLDVTNADDADPGRGVQLLDDGSFFWRAFTDDISGGTLDFAVTPPIPTLSQSGLAIMAMLTIVLVSIIVGRRARAPGHRSRPLGPV